LAWFRVAGWWGAALRAILGFGLLRFGDRTGGLCRVVALPGPGQALQGFVDLLGSFTSCDEFGRVREWLADAAASVFDFPVGVFDVGLHGGFAFFQPGETVFQADHQPGRVGALQVVGWELDACAGRIAEADGHVGVAE
jgi:hypothetical protein